MSIKICPYCAEEIKVDALKCKHCGEWIESKPKGVSTISWIVSNLPTLPNKRKRDYYFDVAQNIFVHLICGMYATFGMYGLFLWFTFDYLKKGHYKVGPLMGIAFGLTAGTWYFIYCVKYVLRRYKRWKKNTEDYYRES